MQPWHATERRMFGFFHCLIMTGYDQKKNLQHISSVWSQLNSLTTVVVGSKEDSKTSSVTFQGIKHKFP